MTGPISRRSLLLFFADALVIPLAFLLADYLKAGTMYLAIFIHPLVFLSFLVYLIMLYMVDFYYPYKFFHPLQTAVEVVYAIALGSFFIFSVSYLDRSFLISRSVLIMSVGLLALAIYTIRMAYDAVFRSRFLDKRALIVGTGPFACEIRTIIERTPHSGIHIVGFVAEGET